VLTTAIISYKRFTFKRDANRKLSQANQELMQTLEDLKLAEQQLLQAEKMASLGRVTAGIAHELRNPLNFIHNFASIASDTINEFIQADPKNKEVLAEDLKTSIEKIKFHGNKAEQIITTMLKHGKDKILDTDDVSLNELMTESITIATKNFGFKHEGFQCKVGIDSPQKDIRIRVNPKSIPLVIGNLIDNAMYSVMQKSKIAPKGYQPEVNLHVEKDKKGLLLEINDNGIGLERKNLNEIFEPFYTTKPTGHGTGLGLSICYEILKAHGASINAKNNNLGGVTFSILFPNTLIIN
jgi:signal transduction histidine kinase